jgi:hypothetical protein
MFFFLKCKGREGRWPALSAVLGEEVLHTTYEILL